MLQSQVILVYTQLVETLWRPITRNTLPTRAVLIPDSPHYSTRKVNRNRNRTKKGKETDMEILRKSREDMNKKDLYFLVTSPEIKKMRELAGTTVNLIDWVMFNSVDRETGELYKVISIKTDSGVYATNSPTMIETFEQVIACFGDDFSSINIFEGKSNKGRSFLMCSYAE